MSSFPGWYLKRSCDNGAKQPPGKCKYVEMKSLPNKVRWGKTAGMDTTSFEKIEGLRYLEVPLKKCSQNFLDAPRISCL